MPESGLRRAGRFGKSNVTTKSGVTSAGGSYSKQLGNGLSSRPEGRDEKPTEKKATTAAPTTPIPPTPAPVTGAPNQPVTSANQNLPADRVQAHRGQRRSLGAQIRDPQGSAQHEAQSYRGQPIAPVMGNIYGETIPGFNRPVTKQQFNGQRGQKTVLGQ